MNVKLKGIDIGLEEFGMEEDIEEIILGAKIKKMGT